MNTQKLIVAAGIALSLVTVIHAEDNKKRRPSHPIPPEIIKRFDKDGDGKLNEEEREAAKAAREEIMKEKKEEMLKKFDANKDGNLDEEEREAMREAMKKKALEKFDKDGDGQLNEEEREAMRKEMGPRLMPNDKKGEKRKEGRPAPEKDEEAPGVLGE